MGIMTTTQLEPDRALFDGQIETLVAAISENERPLAGLAGLLDWRFHGVISQGLRAGAITGAPGECVYLPVTKNGKNYRLILVGAGKSSRPGERTVLSPDSLRVLQKNLASMKFSS